MIKNYFVFMGIAASLISCTSAHGNITRDEILAIAESYLKHQWIPTQDNVYHGYDKDNIRVDTPDSSFQKRGYQPGWWIPNRMNTGVPYMWGGFCSLAEFDQGIKEGKYAGDIYTHYKRANLGRARSNFAVGIDCSGFVSRCWNLPHHHSTRKLHEVSDVITDVNELRPGDILNKYNAHVYLFVKFVDNAKTVISVYHATTHKVKQERFPLQALLTRGFQAYRYKQIKAQSIKQNAEVIDEVGRCDWISAETLACVGCNDPSE